MKLTEAEGIELPAMYKLGYNNSNCIGCVKGGMGYWNRIRIDFPEVFERMSKIEQKVGHSCIKGTFLKDLDPSKGRHKLPVLPECGAVCPVELDGLKELDDPELIKNRIFEI